MAAEGESTVSDNGNPAEGRTRLWGRPWTLWLWTAWCALVVGTFLVRFFAYLDGGYGLTDKLRSEGLLSTLSRWLGF